MSYAILIFALCYHYFLISTVFPRGVASDQLPFRFMAYMTGWIIPVFVIAVVLVAKEFFR